MSPSSTVPRSTSPHARLESCAKFELARPKLGEVSGWNRRIAARTRTSGTTSTKCGQMLTKCGADSANLGGKFGRVESDKAGLDSANVAPIWPLLVRWPHSFAWGTRRTAPPDAPNSAVHPSSADAAADAMRAHGACEQPHAPGGALRAAAAEGVRSSAGRSRAVVTGRVCALTGQPSHPVADHKQRGAPPVASLRNAAANDESSSSVHGALLSGSLRKRSKCPQRKPSAPQPYALGASGDPLLCQVPGLGSIEAKARSSGSTRSSGAQLGGEERQSKMSKSEHGAPVSGFSVRSTPPS